MDNRATHVVSAVLVPTGTVTFLLTDVEGSTRLWEHDGGGMAAAVRLQYEILDQAIAAHGGVRPVEQGEGDSVVAAFTLARDAVAAALDAQRALAAADWPPAARLRVRMALHSADAQLRDEGNYFGGALSRCARLRELAGGGQVLVSAATAELVADQLPAGAGLLDAGVHRLRDLGRAERVLALSHPDLPVVALPLRSGEELSRNLPVQLTSFVGRGEELAALAELLQSTRLVTLTGAGGCGKTRLVLQLAAEVRDRYPDGVWWVELAALTDPELVELRLATAIGVRPLPGQTPLEASVFHLAGRRGLVLLDNCEHLLESCAGVADALRHGCPEVTILATSREPLGVGGESVWRVPSLSLPSKGAGRGLSSLRQSDAVRLFIERATKVRPNFALSDTTAPYVARICEDLDGIPLAIELAAARVRVLSVERIAAGVADRFRLLTGGSRGALPRQQTLRASVDWSYELLDDQERALLCRLGVFHGGFTLDACEEAVADESLDRYAVLDVLTSLLDKSLVLMDERESQTRYRLLETVRHYALERLAAAGEVNDVRNRHLDAFLALAERTEPDLLSEHEPEALELLDAEGPNLEAAIEWALATAPSKALRLCAALTFWWRLRGLFAAGESACSRALEAAPRDRSRLRAQALWGRAYLAISAGEGERGRGMCEEVLSIGEELEDEWIQGRALHALALMQAFSDPAASARLAQRARELARTAGDDFTWADATQMLSLALWQQDDYDGSRREGEAAFEAAARIGNREIIAIHWVMQGHTPWGSGEVGRRRTLLERGLRVAAEIGEPASAGFGAGFLGWLEIQTGAAAQALERLERALDQLITAGTAWPIAGVQYQTGVALTSLGRFDEARGTLDSLVEREADGSPCVLSFTLSALASVERIEGDLESARGHADRAIEVARNIGSASLVGRGQSELGRIAATTEMWAEAEDLLQQALGAMVDTGQDAMLPDLIEALAEVAAGLESHAEAARLLAAAARARADFGLVRWTGEDEHWQTLEHDLRETLGHHAYRTATTEGSALTIEEAVAYVRRARGSRKRPPRGWESLTPTELEVAQHAAAGLTNPEIGERMFISRGTVKIHLSHIYAKLAIRNRAELTAYIARRAHPTSTSPRPANR